MDHNTPHIQPATTQLPVPHLLIATLARVPHLSRSHRDEWDIRAKHEPLSFPGRKYLLALAIFIAATLPAQAQWDIEESHTTASLRGIHNVGGGVAWASGTDGTVLRTEDGGYLWQVCAIPPGAEKLDFRGIQAFDENTAIVMSSGKGDLSRLYKTTDGCRTWKLIFTNPDKEGFWDAVKFKNATHGLLVGDPIYNGTYFSRHEHKFVRKRAFPLYATTDSGLTWLRVDGKQLYGGPFWPKDSFKSIFAASNSSLLELEAHSDIIFVTGGETNGLEILRYSKQGLPLIAKNAFAMTGSVDTKLAQGEAAGGFSIAVDSDTARPVLNVVGGDYKLPDDQEGTASTCVFGSKANLTEPLTFYMCEPAQTPPHGYRSSVAYDPTTKTWITVGPNGTDISRDDGRNWSPLKPTATEPQDADKNWNALSLPFVVGPKGRIGKLRDNAIATAASSKKEKDKKE
jgi:hypothetical protein